MTEKMNKFERLAEKRVTEAIKKIRLVGNLANKNNYQYTEGHVKELIEALDNEMKALKNRFKDEVSSEVCGFSFKKNK